MTYLIKTMENLDKTIGNLRLDIKSKMDGISYQNWTKILDDAYKEFLSLYTSCNEDIYQAAKKEHHRISHIVKCVNRDMVMMMRNFDKNKKAEKEKLFGSDRDYDKEGLCEEQVRKHELAKQLLDSLPAECNTEEFLKTIVNAANEWKEKQVLDENENEKSVKNNSNEEKKLAPKKKSRWEVSDEASDVQVKKPRIE